MRALWLVLLLTLAGCGQGVFDTPVKREYTKPTVTITWVEVETEQLLYVACQHHGMDTKVLACAHINPQTNNCTIYTHKNPSIDILGHEALHCFTGRWHA